MPLAPQSFGHNRFTLQIRKKASPVTIQQKDNVLSVTYTSGIQWYFNDIQIPGATSSSIIATENGTYRVEVNAAGCALMGLHNYSITGIETSLTGIIIYPNPVSKKLSIESRSGFIKSIEIINTAGNTIEEVTGLDGFMTDQTELDLTHLSSGVYVLRIVSGNEVYMRRVVKK